MHLWLVLLLVVVVARASHLFLSRRIKSQRIALHCITLRLAPTSSISLSKKCTPLWSGANDETQSEPMILTGFAGIIDRRSRPSPVGIPRKKMDLNFAVQLMRNSYNAVGT